MDSEIQIPKNGKSEWKRHRSQHSSVALNGVHDDNGHRRAKNRRCDLRAGWRSWLQVIIRLQHLFGACADGDAVGQIDPADRAC